VSFFIEISPDAVADLFVSALSPTSTMCASPEELK